MGQKKPPEMPKAPEAEKASESYKAGIKTDLKYAPMLAQQEMDLRNQFAPQQANLGAKLYGEMLPKIAGANMATLNKVDPESIKGRKQLYGNVSKDLALGTSLDPQFEAQIGQYIRGAQAARGNVLGAAPAGGEALYKGEAAQKMYQQRLGNMGDFLRGPTPESHFAELAGLGGPSLQSSTVGQAGMNYLDHSAGDKGIARAEIDQKNALDAWKNTAMPRAGHNPWMGALAGAGAGASTGGQFGGAWGALGGAIIGGVEGGVGTGWGVGGSAAAGV